MTQYGAPHEAHIPVFLDRVCELLAPALARPGAVAVDATLGAGGHTEALLSSHPALTVLGVDRDRDALALAGGRLARFGERFVPVHAVYDRIPDVLAERDIPGVDGVLFDLGVSSMQLDVAGRGFAYAQDAPLDMRMDQSTGPTAEDVVNGYDERELSRILRLYGEERFAPRIAKAIVKRRKESAIRSSRELVELVREAVPAAARRRGGNPAKRTFQALRIEVNAELDVLRRAVPAALDALLPGGRIVVLSYHSLEDRIVKRELAARTTSSAPPGLPIDLPGTEPTMRLISKGALPPSEDEIAANPRAASAKLRAAEALPTDTESPDTPYHDRRRSLGEDDT
ncbi:16S rRNA (cytosine1402-N4)-methyltransferase [Stackebrandtia albiflava]|uniref:Ribosomal RNA small subunit methyltransferase H n=1 Tax=Stackebrandtia albiflava TaxID=406432 RepID=A0A562VC89_9ACTN|nr:16S rRNA (cytosine(1402)-N(4))-methyltransferase RsmH [Stackebrandtia albiflava]TWJ15431.1 16S rRNA (cytosine1402-N4)-methyltransferase [Stackebrandtia albiflava]